MMQIGPVTLEDAHVRLVPLSHDHGPALLEGVAQDGLHRLWYTSVPAPDGMAAEIDRRLGLLDTGEMVPFTVVTPEGDPVGMTTYMHIDRTNHRLEIGHTWLLRGAQGRAINTAAKRLLLTHAFDTLGCIAVEFRTHYLNRQSRQAIERLGARLDGILRHHMVMPDGSLRDTAVYSVTRPEWPAVRSNLDWQLARPR